jgi:hypothetical protein
VNFSACRRGSVWLLALGLTILILGAGDSDLLEQLVKPTIQINLETIAASDPRIEPIARALCVAHGLDPDHDQPPFPGPLWERFILEARDWLAEHDAELLWEQRHARHQGPPNE